MELNNLPPGVKSYMIPGNRPSDEKNFFEPKIRTVYGEKAMFCCDGCKDSFMEDKFNRMIYPQYKLKSGNVVSWSMASIKERFCAYCRTQV
jgi:hypothetical protein